MSTHETPGDGIRSELVTHVVEGGVEGLTNARAATRSHISE